MEGQEWRVGECHYWIQNEFKASLGYMRFFFLKTNEKNKTKNNKTEH